MKNVFCYNNLLAVGGIEEFFYQLAKKYSDHDITIIYKKGDINQINRLRKYVRVIKFTGQTIQCEKAFFNYYADFIDYVEAKEYGLIIHSDFKAQLKAGIITKEQVPTYTKIKKYYGVSQLVCDSFYQITGIRPELVYNPFEADKPKKLLKLVSTTRLTAEKRLDQIIKFGEILNKYCKETGNAYIWLIFTNDTVKINNPNIIFMKPRLDVEPFIKNSDYLVQFTLHESYCYAITKSLCLGIPIITNDIPVFKELNIDDRYGFVVKDIEEINVDEVFKKTFNFKYEPPKSEWDKILAKGKSNYKYDENKLYKVKALDVYIEKHLIDKKLGREPKKDEIWEVTNDRLDVLLGENDYNIPLVEVVE